MDLNSSLSVPILHTVINLQPSNFKQTGCDGLVDQRGTHNRLVYMSRSCAKLINGAPSTTNGAYICVWLFIELHKWSRVNKMQTTAGWALFGLVHDGKCVLSPSQIVVSCLSLPASQARWKNDNVYTKNYLMR